MSRPRASFAATSRSRWWGGSSSAQSMVSRIRTGMVAPSLLYGFDRHQACSRAHDGSSPGIACGLGEVNPGQTRWWGGMMALPSLNQTLTSTLKTATRYVRCPWVFVNSALMDAWQANPE
jgi:hypothetical protein